MFQVYLPDAGRTVRVWFRHQHYTKPKVDGRYFHRLTKGHTECVIVDAATRKPLKGWYPETALHAYCSVADNFDKEVGRKLALRRRLQFEGFSREDRRHIWRAYHLWRGHGPAFQAADKPLRTKKRISLIYLGPLEEPEKNDGRHEGGTTQPPVTAVAGSVA